MEWAMFLGWPTTNARVLQYTVRGSIIEATNSRTPSIKIPLLGKWVVASLAIRQVFFQVSVKTLVNKIDLFKEHLRILLLTVSTGLLGCESVVEPSDIAVEKRTYPKSNTYSTTPANTPGQA